MYKRFRGVVFVEGGGGVGRGQRWILLGSGPSKEVKFVQELIIAGEGGIVSVGL